MIRNYVSTDHRPIMQLWQDTGLSIRDSDAPAEVEKFLAGGGKFLVAEEHGQVVGTLLGGWDGRRGWLYHLAVAPMLQGSGLGRSLMDEMERWLRSRGALQVNLLVEPHNAKVAGFYQRLGFAGEPMTLMRKPLG